MATSQQSEIETCVSYQEGAACAHWMVTWERENGALSRAATLQDRAAHYAEQARDRLDRINGHA